MTPKSLTIRMTNIKKQFTWQNCNILLKNTNLKSKLLKTLK